MSRLLRSTLKGFLHRLFVAGQYLGVDVLPRHFYSEVPDLRLLKKSGHWRTPFSMTDVQGADLEQQSQAVTSLLSPEIGAELAHDDIYSMACAMNGAMGFGPIEAQCLYAFVRTHRPRQILQIGCGVSTAICLLAAKRSNYEPQLICVEPFPTDYLTAQARNGAIDLLRIPAQQLPLSRIDNLETDCLLFVDSTHTLGPAGEVTRIILEMLPRLKPRAWAHFHDIRFPYDYDRRLVSQALFFQHESPLLHAFLCCNSRFRIEFSMSMLHYGARDVLHSCFPRYRPAQDMDGLETAPGHFPSSTYLRAIA